MTMPEISYGPHTDHRPLVVCLCGSTRFKEEFLKAEVQEALVGHIVLSVEIFGHADGLTHTDDQKRRLDELHLRKIDLADEVLVIAGAWYIGGGYIGESTAREIAYARAHDKPIRWHLLPPPQQP